MVLHGLVDLGCWATLLIVVIHSFIAVQDPSLNSFSIFEGGCPLKDYIRCMSKNQSYTPETGSCIVQVYLNLWLISFLCIFISPVWKVSAPKNRIDFSFAFGILWFIYAVIRQVHPLRFLLPCGIFKANLFQPFIFNDKICESGVFFL